MDDHGHACTAGAGQLNHLRVDERVVALQLVDDAQRKLLANPILGGRGAESVAGCRRGSRRAAGKNGARRPFGPSQMRLDLGHGLRHAAARLAALEVLDASLADAGEVGELLLREAACFTRGPGGGGELGPLQVGPILCHGGHHAARFGNTHPGAPLIDQD